MLLEARKRAPLERAYAAYGRHLLRRDFARVRVGGVPFPDGAAPTIAFLNHSAWWDPIVALFLSHDLFRRDGVGLMQGEQLRRFPFFRRVGCFGTTTGSLDDARRVGTYAATLLRERPRRTLWIFPQGALLPPGAPVAFRSGTARLARAVPEAVLVPVAVRYQLRDAQRPEVIVRVGPPMRMQPREPVQALTRRLESALRHELAMLDHDLTRPALDDGYPQALRGARSVSELYERTVGRLRGDTPAGTGPTETAPGTLVDTKQGPVWLSPPDP